MAKQSIKSLNKKRKRRLDGLKSKCYMYGQLPDIHLALIIHNRAKKEFYTFISADEVLSWPTMGQIVSQPPSSRHLLF